MAAGLGLSAIGEIGKIFGRGAANRRLRKLLEQDPQWKDRYVINPVAQQRLGLAQQLLNARMPGAAGAERNIYNNEANTNASFSRNATNSAQLLNLLSASQGQTNDALNKLGIEESQDYGNRLQNLNSAQQGIITEGDKVYQDKQYKHEDDVRRFHDKLGVYGAMNQNNQANWGSLSNFGFGLANMGAAGAKWGDIWGNRQPNNGRYFTI